MDMESFQKQIAFVVMYDPSQKSTTTEKQSSFTMTPLKDLLVYETYVLLLFDYFALYVPRLWLDRFHFLKNVHEPRWGGAYSPTPEGLYFVDMSQDLQQCTCKNDLMLDFSLVPECLFHILQGSCWTFISMKQRRVLRYLMPLVEFLGPCPAEVEYWRKKSQGSSFLLDMDL